jgi:hypothetical protein
MNEELEGFWIGLAVLFDDGNSLKMQKQVTIIANTDSTGGISGQYELIDPAGLTAPELRTYTATREGQTVYVKTDTNLSFQVSIIPSAGRMVAQGMVDTQDGTAVVTVSRPGFRAVEKVLIQGAWPSHN